MGPMHSAETKARAMAVMERSARKSPTGDPNLAHCSRETEIPRKTLRNWWLEREPQDAADNRDEPRGLAAVGASVAGSVDGFLEECADLLGIEDLTDPRVRILAGVALDRASCVGSAMARVAASKLYVDTFEKYRSKDAREDTGPKTPEEWVALMVEMPALLVEALKRSPEARKLARVRRVLEDEGGSSS